MLDYVYGPINIFNLIFFAIDHYKFFVICSDAAYLKISQCKKSTVETTNIELLKSRKSEKVCSTARLTPYCLAYNEKENDYTAKPRTTFLF